MALELYLVNIKYNGDRSRSKIKSLKTRHVTPQPSGCMEMSPRKKYSLIQAYYFRPGPTVWKLSWFYINFTAKSGLLYVVNNYFLTI